MVDIDRMRKRRSMSARSGRGPAPASKSCRANRPPHTHHRWRATDSGMACHTAVSVVVRSSPLSSVVMRTLASPPLSTYSIGLFFAAGAALCRLFFAAGAAPRSLYVEVKLSLTLPVLPPPSLPRVASARLPARLLYVSPLLGACGAIGDQQNSPAGPVPPYDGGQTAAARLYFFYFFYFFAFQTGSITAGPSSSAGIRSASRFHDAKSVQYNGCPSSAS